MSMRKCSECPRCFEGRICTLYSVVTHEGHGCRQSYYEAHLQRMGRRESNMKYRSLQEADAIIASVKFRDDEVRHVDCLCHRGGSFWIHQAIKGYGRFSIDISSGEAVDWLYKHGRINKLEKYQHLFPKVS